jgi:spore maturation protein CgeB
VRDIDGVSNMTMVYTEGAVRGSHQARPGYRILFVGPQFHGSNSTGLARAFRRLGHIVETIDEGQFFPVGDGLKIKCIRRLCRPLFADTMSSMVLEAAARLRPELLVVFKGSYLTATTLRKLKTLCGYSVLFYPDINVTAHANIDIHCIPLYDWIFTTKSFGIADLQDTFGTANCEVLHHGFDPDVHRPVGGRTVPEEWHSDASFIGAWSPKKERYLTELTKRLSNLRLRIWGGAWQSVDSCLRPAVMGRDVFGDTYALAITLSKVNIALLTEVRPGASMGDQVTSRTFHIPATGGFMLHERTMELATFYREGAEIACFDCPEELAEKTSYYLSNPEERERIRLAGHQRCVAENDLLNRAQRIIQRFETSGSL